MKIITVLGARPQFIKAASVSQDLKKAGLTEMILHTGQHYDPNMSDVFFNELGIPAPQFHLGIHGGTHGEMTGKMLEGAEKIFLKEKPDLVLVYGDTNSTLAGALAAAKLHIPVAHVEAGLRSFNKKMPEEVNRILTDQISDYLFTPTSVADENLKREGFAAEKIIKVGDVMYDAALKFGEKADKLSQILVRHSLNSGKYILVTAHRAENTDDLSRMNVIVDSLRNVSEKMKIVFSVHPRTKKLTESRQELHGKLNSSILLIEPVGYLDMIKLEKNAALIVTDSGGVQKEAYFYGVPCVTLRDQTEWTELVQSGWNTLVSPVSTEHVTQTILKAIGTHGQNEQFYGDGSAGVKIARSL
ncbi:MAG: non-hydrolyzing UDP-N-acetylglucosamine 2-epimerase [Pseudobdellovibrio sp.]